MTQILSQIKETVGTLLQTYPNNPPSDVDLQILLQLGMQGLIPQGMNGKVKKLAIEKDFWHPPPQGFMKFNIDGASKGNLGTAGYGGVLRDENGCIHFIFHFHLGRATNNMAELIALEKSLDILK